MRDLYGHTSVDDFGPLALKTCRNHLIHSGVSRSYINDTIDEIRRMFKRMPISVARLLERFEKLDICDREVVYASVISLLDYGQPE